MKANFATFANALCHLNATPLSVAVLAPCAWGKNLARGGAWQGVLLGRNGAWQNSTARQRTTQQIRLGKCGKMVFAGKTKRGDTANSARRKWGSVWAGDFSLSLSLSLLALLAH